MGVTAIASRLPLGKPCLRWRRQLTSPLGSLPTALPFRQRWRGHVVKNACSEHVSDCVRTLPGAGAQAVAHAARELAGLVSSPFDPGLPAQVDARARELAPELGEVFAPPGAAGAAVISGLVLDNADLGPTPQDWSHAGVRSLSADIAMMLLARCAGVPFGWQGQQAGRIVNNVVPAAGHEDEQTGASSATLLAPHTEDAFHPRRANMLLLGCMRNPDLVATTLSSVRQVQLDEAHRRLLAAPTLPILPDISYGAVPDTGAAPTVSTLWDGPQGPTLRYDPAYTPLPRARAEFRAAYEALTTELERVSYTVALEAGQLLLVDNDVAVHGRVPFTARYDGTDRWLKRVNLRLPQRLRDPAEAAEDGYGQKLVEPYAAAPGRRPSPRPHPALVGAR
ncbi:MAG: iron hydroxylase [Mycobacteriaceae bacterium]|nr:iron hydroxylase [Mycobacteriaceae bacterium]